ncbi:MAG: LysM peptidoglycan-binding domain-containing protein, partial [Candidatus Margulisbacteria bacterium]|nr:LysM peptidoglycan-binding domain-containing protein [Candidatus Margulisiibacteriota bacterium]
MDLQDNNQDIDTVKNLISGVLTFHSEVIQHLLKEGGAGYAVRVYFRHIGVAGDAISYAIDLKDEKDSHGNEGYRAELVTGVDIGFSMTASTIGGAIASAALAGTSFPFLVSAGIVTAAVIGASIAYDYAVGEDENNVVKDWVRDAYDTWKENSNDTNIEGLSLTNINENISLQLSEGELTINTDITNEFSVEELAINYSDSFISNPEFDDHINSVAVTDSLSLETITYNIKSGDTVSNIAAKFGKTIEEIQQAQGNEWLDSRTSEDGSFILIKPGETINIPEVILEESLKISGADGSQTIYNFEDQIVSHYDPNSGWSNSDWDLSLPYDLTVDFEDVLSSDFGFDNSSWDGSSLLDNFLLDFESVISPISNNAGIDPNAWMEGSALHGGDYSANMPIDIINGPGFTFEQLSKNITDDYQPGDMTLTDNRVDYGIDAYLDKYFAMPSLDLDLDPPANIFEQPFENYIGDLAKMNSLFLAAPDVERVDPLVVDLNGDGVQLISFEDSTVTFDVDNDGYAENTGWVSAEDGIIVHDKNQDGVINDISETLSEYYTENVIDGLEALQTLDSNKDGLFNKFDDVWSDLKVWQDQNLDGISQSEEMKTLDESGIASISLDRQESDRERLEGNPVLSRSSMRMTDGTEREVAAVDFTTNPLGYEWNEVFDGAEVKTEDGSSSSFVITTSEGQTVNVAEKNVNSIYGNIGDDTLIGNDEANWLIGGAGSETFQAGAGDDLLVIDADDLQENIDAGEGLDIIRVADSRDVSLNLSEMNAEILNSGGGNDVLIGGGLSNVFINGGAGSDVIIGGA